MTIVQTPLLLLAATFAQSDVPVSTRFPELPIAAKSIEGFVSPGWIVAAKARGDLNGDGRPDIALALWTEQASKSPSYVGMTEGFPYRLVIGFAESDGRYRLVVDNKQLLVPPGATGAYEDGLGPDSLNITRGALRISRDLLRGHYNYKFRWSVGEFRLVGYEYSGSDGRCITETSINFLTRKAVIATEGIGEDSTARRFVRRVSRAPVTIKQASAEDYDPYRDLSGPPTYCISEGHRF